MLTYEEKKGSKELYVKIDGQI